MNYGLRRNPDGRIVGGHAPGAKLDYSVFWELAAAEDIVESAWTSVAGISMGGAQISDLTFVLANAHGEVVALAESDTPRARRGKFASIVVEGGVEGVTYVMRNTVTYADGRKDSRVVTLRCF